MAGQSRTCSLDIKFLMLVTAAVHSVHTGFSSNIAKRETAVAAEETTTVRSRPTSQTIDVQEEFGSIGNDGHVREPSGVVVMKGEDRLYAHLVAKQKLHRASHSTRPVDNAYEAVNVSFAIRLKMIIELDGMKQVLTTKVLTFMLWKDPLLVWNPTEYDSLEEIHFPQTEIWKPDIELFNNADEKKASETFPTVRNSGEILWISAVLFKSSCSINIRNFPYDEQMCKMTFISWTYSDAQLNLSLLSHAAFSDMTPNPEWDLLNFTAEKIVDEFSSNIFLEFSLHLVRRSGINTLVLVLPTLMLTFLTIAVFLEPIRRNDRTANAMGLFSSFFIVLLILVQSCPPSAASLSLLGIYHCLNMAIIAVWLVIVTALQEIMEGKHRRPIPAALRMVFLKLIAKLICIRTDTATSSTDQIDMADNKIYPTNAPTSSTTAAVLTKETSEMDEAYVGCGEVVITTPVAKEAGLLTTVRQRLSISKSMIDTAGDIKQHEMKQDTETEDVMTEWRLLAKTVDRFISIVFSLCICVALVVVFPKPSFSSTI